MTDATLGGSMRRLAVLCLVGVFASSCMPKQFYAPYRSYLDERKGTSDEAKTRLSETGERYCGDLEREGNVWSTAHTGGTIVLGVLAAASAIVGSALVVQSTATDSTAMVDRPKNTAGLSFQGAGVLLGGLATLSGLRGSAASRAAAEAGDSAAKGDVSDATRYQRCRAVLAAWEDRRDFIKEVNAQRPTLAAASNKFNDAMSAVNAEAADGGVSMETLKDAQMAKESLLKAVEQP